VGRGPADTRERGRDPGKAVYSSMANSLPLFFRGGVSDKIEGLGPVYITSKKVTPGRE